MNQQQYNYKFYATLLDAFKWYQASESENAEQEFIDKINRVPVTDEKALERMNHGTALNDLVDKMLNVEFFILHEQYPIKTDKYEYEFSGQLLSELCGHLNGATPQHYTETSLTIDGKTVLLYGYIDYVRESKCIDLKTTSSYDLGKYKGGMQRHLYPFSLSNEGIYVDEFEFLVTDFKSVFKEPYKVDLVESEMELTGLCKELIAFVESKKHLITDKKIFALDEVGV